MKTTLGRAPKKDAMRAILDVDKALAGKPSSYTKIDLPIPETKSIRLLAKKPKFAARLR